jgi:hypothetical protein
MACSSGIPDPVQACDVVLCHRLHATPNSSMHGCGRLHLTVPADSLVQHCVSDQALALALGVEVR